MPGTPRVQARNHRHAVLQWPVVVEAVHEHLTATIQVLDERLTALEAEIDAGLAASTWADSAVRLTSIPGIGPGYPP